MIFLQVACIPTRLCGARRSSRGAHRSGLDWAPSMDRAALSSTRRMSRQWLLVMYIGPVTHLKQALIRKEDERDTSTHVEVWIEFGICKPHPLKTPLERSASMAYRNQGRITPQLLAVHWPPLNHNASVKPRRRGRWPPADINLPIPTMTVIRKRVANSSPQTRLVAS